MKKIVLILTMFIACLNTASADGPIDVLARANNSSSIRDKSISADITGHTLTITFNDNVGIAHIVIKDSNGVYIDRENVFSTPDYATFFINDAGYYRMDITLSNGEQYYGYFRVEL